MVRRYRSWPAKSVNEMTLAERLPISSHDNFRPGTSDAMTLPAASNPIISMPTELVRPLSISCLCRNRLTRALPRPSSRPPFTNTPSKVLLPASTLPTTAIRVSMTSSTVSGFCRINIFPLQSLPFSGTVTVSASASPPTFFVSRIWHSALCFAAASFNLDIAVSHSSFVRLMDSPLFSNPTSKTVSPCPSSIRPPTTSTSFANASSSLLRRSSFNRTCGAESARSRESRMSSSAWSSVKVAPLREGYRFDCCFSTYSANSLSAYIH